MNHPTRFFHYVWLALLLAPLARAQTPVQLVTKVVEKELPLAEGQRIRLNAQKADVVVRGWSRNVVGVRLRLTARHPDRAVAERELAYHQYVLDARGAEVELSNRFVIPQRAGRLQSGLKAVFEVNVPARAVLNVNNAFGDVALRGLAGDVTLTFAFGKLSLDDVAGKLTITSDYGDIDGQGVNATLVCRAEKADISLRNLGGSSQIQSRYGKLMLTLNSATLDALRVEAARTEILLIPKRMTDFRYDVVVSQADIQVPTTYADQLGRYGGKRTFTLQPPGRKAEVSVQNTYSPVIIQEERQFSSK